MPNDVFPLCNSPLQASLRTLDLAAQQEREQQAAAMRRSITDTETKIKRTVRNLELIEDPDPDLIRDINERRAELRAQKQHYVTQLADLEARILHAPNPDLINALPITEIQIDQLPEALARSSSKPSDWRSTTTNTPTQPPPASP